LEEKFRSKDPELIVIYGRRRIGKTELIARFVRGKPAVYFLADRRPERDLLEEFRGKMSQVLGDESFSKLEISGWLELFKEFLKWWKGGRVIIVIDEFPMLIEDDKAIPSVFQKIWDLELENSQVMLILLGSSISMMETEVLSYRSPLYGRRTGQWKLQPLRFHHLRGFFKEYLRRISLGFTGVSAEFRPIFLSLTQMSRSGITWLLEYSGKASSFMARLNSC